MVNVSGGHRTLADHRVRGWGRTRVDEQPRESVRPGKGRVACQVAWSALGEPEPVPRLLWKPGPSQSHGRQTLQVTLAGLGTHAGQGRGPCHSPLGAQVTGAQDLDFRLVRWVQNSEISVFAHDGRTGATRRPSEPPRLASPGHHSLCISSHWSPMQPLSS